MDIKRFDVWIKLADAPCKKLEDGRFQIAVFDRVKFIKGKKYGLFNRFITMTREEMEEG